MDITLLKVTLSRSPGLAGLLACVQVAAAACLVAYLPAWIAAPGLAALGWSLAFHVRRDALLLSPQAIIEAVVREDGQCDLYTRSGHQLTGQLDGRTFVSSPLVVLGVRLHSGRWRPILILPDSAAADVRRRLRVWLRFRVRPEASGSLDA